MYDWVADCGAEDTWEGHTGDGLLTCRSRYAVGGGLVGAWLHHRRGSRVYEALGGMLSSPGKEREQFSS